MNRARWFFSLLAAGGLFLALALTAASVFAQQSAPPPPPKKKARKVWTEDDLQQLQGRGVNVVGTSIEKPEEAAAPAGQAAAKQPAAATNFYSDLSMEERERWVAKYEREIADAEATLVELRGRALTAPTEEERAAARAVVEKLEGAIEQNRVEIELIRNTPPPKPAKKPAAKPKPAAPAVPSAPTSPSV